MLKIIILSVSMRRIANSMYVSILSGQLSNFKSCDQQLTDPSRDQRNNDTSQRLKIEIGCLKSIDN